MKGYGKALHVHETPAEEAPKGEEKELSSGDKKVIAEVEPEPVKSEAEQPLSASHEPLLPQRPLSLTDQYFVDHFG